MALRSSSITTIFPSRQSRDMTTLIQWWGSFCHDYSGLWSIVVIELDGKPNGSSIKIPRFKDAHPAHPVSKSMVFKLKVIYQIITISYSFDNRAILRCPGIGFKKLGSTYRWATTVITGKMGFKVTLRKNNWIRVVISRDCRLSNIILISYLKSHGFLFKILIQMHPLSTDGAIWIWVL